MLRFTSNCILLRVPALLLLPKKVGAGDVIHGRRFPSSTLLLSYSRVIVLISFCPLTVFSKICLAISLFCAGLVEKHPQIDLRQTQLLIEEDKNVFSKV